LEYDPTTNVLRIAAQNPFIIPWLEGRFGAQVHAAVADVLGAPVRVEFVAQTTVTQRRRERPAPLLDSLEMEPTETLELPRPAPEPLAVPVGSPLNPRYTHASFVVGPCNQLAYAASLSVVDKPGQAYNPLFIYGGVGLGKTHLLHAIGHAYAARALPAVYVSSETFTNELIDAIRQHRTDEFRAKYRRAKGLLIDDVQFIGGKERTEEEFHHTFNAIHEAGGQIVLASDRPPRAMSILQERLRSRFEWGLMVDVQPPDYETRIAILRSKLPRQAQDSVPGEVLDFIAQKVQSNIRELEGSLNRLLASSRHLREPVTIEAAARALRDLLSPGPAGQSVTPAAILTAVARYFGVTPEDLKGTARHKRIVGPRQVCMYLLREDAHLSAPEIGRVLHRDHTTVLHGVKLIATDIARDGQARSMVRGVRQVLAAAAPSTRGPSEERASGAIHAP
jgi:chromosomal replication initiator protein